MNDMQTEQLLCWSGMTSSSNKEGGIMEHFVSAKTAFSRYLLTRQYTKTIFTLGNLKKTSKHKQHLQNPKINNL